MPDDNNNDKKTEKNSGRRDNLPPPVIGSEEFRDKLLDKVESAQQKLENFLQKKHNIIGIGQGDKKDPEKQICYVGFYDRMFAFAIDSMAILLILLPLLPFIEGYFYSDTGSPREVFNAILQGGDANIIIQEARDRGVLEAWLKNNLFQMAIISSIILSFWIYCSATPGKWIARMRIVDAKTGCHPSKKQLVLRYLGYFFPFVVGTIAASFIHKYIGVPVISLAIFVIISAMGYLNIIWDSKKQGWHDKIAGTVVIKVKHWRIKASEDSEYPEDYIDDEQ